MIISYMPELLKYTLVYRPYLHFPVCTKNSNFPILVFPVVPGGCRAKLGVNELINDTREPSGNTSIVDKCAVDDWKSVRLPGSSSLLPTRVDKTADSKLTRRKQSYCFSCGPHTLQT
jgi:hypothetical protein